MGGALRRTEMTTDIDDEWAEFGYCSLSYINMLAHGLTERRVA